MAAFSIVSGVALREVASAQVYEKLVQDILHVNGKGVDESYVNGQLDRASISIPRVALGEGNFRMLGASVNGAQFNNKTAVSASSDYIEVPLLYVYDRTETLARVMNDKAGYDLLSQKTANIRRKIARGVNALTFAVQFSKVLNDAYDTMAPEEVITEWDKANGASAKEAYIQANTNLSKGDEALGVDYFPVENRQALVSPDFYGALFKTGDVILNSNIGQEMLASGVLNPFRNGDASKVEMRNGYCGDLQGVPMYQVSPILWKLAAQFCNVGDAPAADNIFAKIHGIVCSSWATIRGFSASENIEVVPAQQGQGWVLQPLVHGGCVCVSSKGCQLIVDNTFESPVVSTATKITIIPPESRA